MHKDGRLIFGTISLRYGDVSRQLDLIAGVDKVPGSGQLHRETKEQENEEGGGGGSVRGCERRGGKNR